MSKKIVVCIDGTWNTPGQVDIDPITQYQIVTPTNVAKTWAALTGKNFKDMQNSYGITAKLYQEEGVAVYFNGVGSEGYKLQRSFNGISGTGTSKRIRDAYRFIAQHWNEGDKLFIFGFSRGAYAARSLCGFIEFSGIPEKAYLLDEYSVENLYDLYRKKEQNLLIKDHHKKCEIDFLGIWDTVGALALSETFNKYHNVSPSNIKHVSHALALDEVREQFEPDFFVNLNQKNEILETWFIGAHSNIGGGYLDSNLSNIALFWILKNASDKGLECDLPSITGWYGESVTGIRRPSYEEFWTGIPFIGDITEALQLSKQPRAVREWQYIHESVYEAIDKSKGVYTPKANLNLAVNKRMSWGI
jgi:uncharacterized protein (DUF2235 family)